MHQYKTEFDSLHLEQLSLAIWVRNQDRQFWRLIHPRHFFQCVDLSPNHSKTEALNSGFYFQKEKRSKCWKKKISKIEKRVFHCNNIIRSHLLKNSDWILEGLPIGKTRWLWNYLKNFKNSDQKSSQLRLFFNFLDSVF